MERNKHNRDEQRGKCKVEGSGVGRESDSALWCWSVMRVKVEEGFVEAMRLHVTFSVDLGGGGGVIEE